MPSPCSAFCSGLTDLLCSYGMQIEMLTYLAGVTKGPVQKVEILINIITVTFDMNQPTQASWQNN